MFTKLEELIKETAEQSVIMGMDERETVDFLISDSAFLDELENIVINIINK